MNDCTTPADEVYNSAHQLLNVMCAHGHLPYTGTPLLLLVVAAVLLIASGFAVRWVSRDDK